MMQGVIDAMQHAYCLERLLPDGEARTKAMPGTSVD